MVGRFGRDVNTNVLECHINSGENLVGKVGRQRIGKEVAVSSKTSGGVSNMLTAIFSTYCSHAISPIKAPLSRTLHRQPFVGAV